MYTNQLRTYIPGTCDVRSAAPCAYFVSAKVKSNMLLLLLVRDGHFCLSWRICRKHMMAVSCQCFHAYAAMYCPTPCSLRQYGSCT